MKNSNPDFLKILQVLRRHKVDFIIVGGVCAVLHGAPVATFDLDIVHSRADENIQRLLKALRELESVYRGQGKRRLKPDESHLKAAGHQLLMTKYGPLDLLGTIGNNRSFDELQLNAKPLRIEKGVTTLLLNLDTLIEIKKEVGREKDLAVIGVLKETLRQKSAVGD